MKKLICILLCISILFIITGCVNSENTIDIPNEYKDNVTLPTLENMVGSWREVFYNTNVQSGEDFWTIRSNGDYELTSSWINSDNPMVTEYRRYKGAFLFNTDGLIEQHRFWKADSNEPITDENVNWYLADQVTKYYGIIINNKFHKSYIKKSGDKNNLLGLWSSASYDSEDPTPYVKYTIDISMDEYITNEYVSTDGVLYTDTMNTTIYQYINDEVNKKILLYQNSIFVKSYGYVLSGDWFSLYTPELVESDRGWTKK